MCSIIQKKNLKKITYIYLPPLVDVKHCNLLFLTAPLGAMQSTSNNLPTYRRLTVNIVGRNLQPTRRAE